ncbi:DNA mismatch repair protein [Cryobacterium sp. CG_9.6]|uniref:DNA mismatch repair protein n=1 Tax=Cryobacterium sp. CG_9.6 TaxID=2760710 RepID=UPI0024756A28|nr:DNA mismatch repair protein [Cryobacterium sp. CG_9.6]MDH6237430.1 hypothetical protein [Cryobacterium sp. CG_9.6]
MINERSPHTGPASAAPVMLLPVRSDLWRVVSRSSAVLGHIERQAEPGGDRFEARRLVFASRLVPVGLFCRLDDAADCFR